MLKKICEASIQVTKIICFPKIFPMCDIQSSYDCRIKTTGASEDETQ